MDERVVAKIRRQSLKHNIKTIKGILDDGCKLLAVVKADAYGHGAVECGKLFLENGAEALAVATYTEAKQLREGGITEDILILGELMPGEEQCSQELGLISTVYGAADALQLSKTAAWGKKHRVHLKIDTGMSRVGVYCHRECDLEAAADEAEAVYRQEGIVVEGIYTHFSSADCEDESVTETQFMIFMRVLKILKKRGIDVGIRHCSASAGILYFAKYQLDMVRPGLSLYGYSPKADDSFSKQLKPAMTLEARVVKTTELNASDCISYGATYTVAKPMRVAAVAIGYGDGYSRLLSDRDAFIINGKSAAVCGRVCMDMTIVDIDGIDCERGDKAIIFGDDAKTADDIAAKLGTISYEVLCNVGKRVPRVYE